jgi:uncharacterized protein YciI
MLYSIVATDIKNSSTLRDITREQHIERLNVLKQQNRLIIAGPNPAVDKIEGVTNFTGSVVIAEFDNLSQAQQWADDDPYFKSGAYDYIVVKPFKMVLP